MWPSAARSADTTHRECVRASVAAAGAAATAGPRGRHGRGEVAARGRPAPPAPGGGHAVDPGAAHPRHHREPGDVDFVLVAPRYARYYIVGWAATAGVLALALPGRRGRLRPMLSGLSAAYASLV